MFKATLKFEGNEYNVLKCDYLMDRDTDLIGRPSNEVRGGKISFQIESSQDTVFWDWIINQYAQKDGEIEFMKRNDPTPAKILKFKEAYIISQGENFDVVGNNKEQPMIENITISAKMITMDPGGEFQKIWVE